MFTKEFDIAMPNEPLKNDFSGNAKITGTYKGPRYIKIEYNNDTKIVGNSNVSQLGFFWWGIFASLSSWGISRRYFHIPWKFNWDRIGK